MSLRNEPQDWQFESDESFVPVYYQGKVVGVMKQEYAANLTKLLNEDELLKKALKRACVDLIKQSGGDTSQVKDLMKKYIKMSERPKFGTRAIAFLLRERQEELDLGDREFTKFCDTYKLSPAELNNVYAGEPVEDGLLVPLSRILGITKEKLIEVRDGTAKERGE
jgi:hypothetical protein